MNQIDRVAWTLQDQKHSLYPVPPHKGTDKSRPRLAICSYKSLSVNETEGFTLIRALVK